MLYDKSMSMTKDKSPKELGWSGDQASRLVNGGVILLLATLLIILPMWLVFTAPASVRQFRYNPFAMLSMLSAAAGMIAFILIVRVKQRSAVLMWFSAFLLSIISWAVGEALLRLSATPAAAVFWAPLATPGSTFTSVSLYMFVLSYVNPRESLKAYILPFFVTVSSLFVYLDSYSSLITSYNAHDLNLRPWGYVPTNGPAYSLIAIWATLSAVAAFILLYRFRKRTTDPVLRRQAKLFLIALALPIVGGALTDGLLSALNVEVVPSLAIILLTVMSLIMCYGIVRYQLFSFSPALIADHILGTMNEAVIGIRPDLYISYANKGAEQLFNMSVEQLTNVPLYTFFAKQLATEAALRSRVEQSLGDSGFTVIDALELRVPNKQSTIVKASITKIDDKSQPDGYLVVMTDITELTNAAAVVERQVEIRTHQLHEEQAKLKASIEGLPLGFIFVDGKNDIVAENKALHSIFKQPKAFSIQWLQRQLTNIDLMERLELVRTTGKPIEAREVAVEERVLHLYIAPVLLAEKNSNTQIGCVILVQDITEEKVMARSKDEFFSIASHELRTPLTAIMGNTNIMMNYFKDKLSSEPTLLDMVTDIHESSTRLIEIVNDFLDASRIEQGKMPFSFEALDIGEIVESVFSEMQIVADQKKLSLSFEEKTKPLPKIWADKNRLKQVVYNLVGNAVKFTEKGGITAYAAVEKDMLKLRITDTGHGISLENQKLLFHKFQQATNSILTRDDTRGTGLGLYISGLIAKSMHGDLILERSEEQKGSTFLVSIPLAGKDGDGLRQRKAEVS